MITLFNRREVAITFDLAQQSRIREILRTNKVDYTYRVCNRGSASPFASRRAHTGTFGENQAFANEYKFYVHKKDYEYALHLVNQVRR